MAKLIIRGKRKYIIELKKHLIKTHPSVRERINVEARKVDREFEFPQSAKTIRKLSEKDFVIKDMKKLLKGGN